MFFPPVVTLKTGVLVNFRFEPSLLSGVVRRGQGIGQECRVPLKGKVKGSSPYMAVREDGPNCRVQVPTYYCLGKYLRYRTS